ncbi:MAG: Holliday junction resolvase RuvX [Bacteroidales bacterium]|nr:Holliday junction resolvase RuvX [Bacteroidales bacterium]
MGRVLAIDYGQKRVGFAVTDELRICAHALETVPVAQAFDFLKDYLCKEKVDVVVIGEAKQLDNTPSESCRYIEPFVNRLRKELPRISPGTEIARMDERFTSRIAFQTMIDIGLKKKDRRDKSLVDKMSAAIILQSYLEQQDMINLRNSEQ